MRVRLRAFVLSLCLPIFLLFAFVHLSVFQMIHEVWQTTDDSELDSQSAPFNPKCPEVRSGYCVLANFQPAQAIVGYEDSVTLTTQGTVAFLHHLSEVCDRWRGPISVSVYVPGRDFLLARQALEGLRNRDMCLRKWASWHLIFDLRHPPTSQELLAVTTGNSTLKVNSSYIEKHRLAYPINVARNVARNNARTRFVLASDVELYPSQEIIPMFLDMIRRLQASEPQGFIDRRQVFVLPVFEVSKLSKPPRTKKELMTLVQAKLAVSFHKFMCNTCHQIPQLQKWLQANATQQGVMNVFLSTKRTRKKKLGSWEPFFIGTNKEPYFDERLTWNGKINKMQLAYEMCLLDYDFQVLDGAFLTHAPGIKVFSHKEQAPRARYMVLNNRAYKEILQELRAKYGYNSEC